MKNKFSRSRVVFYSLIFLILGFISVFSQEKFDVKNTEAILISATSAERHDGSKPTGDEALLITDKIEIAKFVRLFDGNQKSGLHACGYHWRITFVRRSAEPLNVWFNQNCEEFEKHNEEICETVQTKFSEIKSKPTYFVTEIGIDVNVSPDNAISKLTENADFNIFILGDLDKRFPFVEIESMAVSNIPEDRKLWDKAKEETRKKAEAFLTDESKRLAKSFAVLKNGDIETKMAMFGGGTIEENLKMKIYFRVGTNLTGIEKNLTMTKYLRKEEPKVYFLQLVSTNRYSKSFRDQLLRDFPFAKEVFAFTSYPR